jgi:hypothetical protein
MSSMTVGPEKKEANQNLHPPCWFHPNCSYPVRWTHRAVYYITTPVGIILREKEENEKNSIMEKLFSRTCLRQNKKVLHQLVADGVMRIFQRINAIAESQFLDSDSFS